MHRRHLAVLPLVAFILLGAVVSASPGSARPLATGARLSADFNGDGIADLAVGVPFEDIGSTQDAGAVNVIYGSSNGLTSTNNQQFYQGNGGVQGTSEVWDAYGYAEVGGDFNADGYADLAIGIPGDTVAGQLGAGAVNVLYGSAGGLTSTGNQLFAQGQDGVLGTPAQYDNFGLSVATGDLNGDGYADLVVGVPFEEVGSDPDAGAINVLYGGAAGLSSTNNQLWNQDSTDIQNQSDPCDPNDPTEICELFGNFVSTGDFNGDGFLDVGVAVPGENADGTVDAGAVNVLYGSGTGLTATGNQYWTQDSPDVSGTAEPFDTFGSWVTSGDFNGDGTRDLAVGAQGESVGTVAAAGAVNVLYGSSPSGLTGTGSQLIYQGHGGISGSAETGDLYGWILASGDFNGDGKGDLAVGVPFEDVGSTVDAGVANVILGSSSGLVTSNNTLWYQGHNGISGSAETEDLFGFVLAAENFGHSSKADLAVGAPFEDLGTTIDAGVVNVLYGSSSGISSTNNQLWSQDSAGILGSAEAYDYFGWGTADGPGRANPRATPRRLMGPR